jgi:hypothetical protein
MTTDNGFRCIFLVALAGALSAVTPAAAASAASDVRIECALRRDTQRLLDAIAPGDTTVWEQLLDRDVVHVDEKDMVRGKTAILEQLKPLGPGLVGHLRIDDFHVGAKAMSRWSLTRMPRRRNSEGRVTRFVDRREARDVVWT